MVIHAIQTGTVQVHERQRSGVGRGIARFARTLFDDEWTPHLPILAWFIEHPEGAILVDTGETARVSAQGYFPWWHPYYRLAVREWVAPEEEIGPRLETLGHSPGDVRRVVMTHLHTDHAGGLGAFPDSEIFISPVEFRAASGFSGRLRGYLPNRWPAWLDPTRIEFGPEPVGTFPESMAVSAEGDVRVVPTPGHTDGHVSVVVDEGDRVLFLAGDASYTEANMMAGVVDGVASAGGSEARAAQSLDLIRRWAAEKPLVYLPSHDPESVARLEGRVAVGKGKRR